MNILKRKFLFYIYIYPIYVIYLISLKKLLSSCFLFGTFSSYEDNLNESFWERNTNGGQINSIVPIDAGGMILAEGITKEDIDIKKMSMIQRVEDGINNFKCTVCGKTTKCGSSIQGMKRHIEVHLEGASYPCNQCGKVSRSSHALQSHITSFHRR